MANIQNDENLSKDFAGVVLKSADVEVQDVTEAELKKINKFTLSPVNAEDVFTFKVTACDNGLDDRNYEPFNLKALKDLKKLYVGKTVIKDHETKSDNQVARIYDTELISSADEVTAANEVFTSLLVKCYMIKTASNADLIAEIKGGIKKEVSTGTRPDKMICSICGKDNTKEYCAHYWGREYDTPTGKQTCYFTLDGAKDAYEMSLVAVPAQPRAGATKHYKDMSDDLSEETLTEEQTLEEDIKDAEIDAQDATDVSEELQTEEPTEKEVIDEDSDALTRVKAAESFIFITQNTEELENE